jgi:hypothetical protein
VKAVAVATVSSNPSCGDGDDEHGGPAIPLPGFKKVAPVVLPTALKARRRSERICDLKDPEDPDLEADELLQADRIMDTEGRIPDLEVLQQGCEYCRAANINYLT